MKLPILLLALTTTLALAQEKTAPTTEPIRVTPDNFVRAETDLYFSTALKDDSFGRLTHRRNLFEIDKQNVIRGNRDTLYSYGVFDLDAAPVTITMPDAGDRFMSLMVLDEDHYIHGVFYGAGAHTFTKDQIGTRYVMFAIRTLVDPNKPGDLDQVHTLQDAIKTEQASPGKFEAPHWDLASQKKVREALLALAATLPDMKGAFGSKDQVDPVRHLIGSASAWGGNPDKEAMYLNVTPLHNDGITPYRLTVKDVPVDAFWSISVYNAMGYYVANKENAYSVNSITAKKNADGSVVIQFGGKPDKTTNYLPIIKGWNYMVRLYRPRQEILDGTWKFPEAQPVP